MLLSGKTALVLGYGRVGTLVGRACIGLGLNVIGVRASIEKEYVGEDGVTVHPVSRLDALLPQAEVLMVTVPVVVLVEVSGESRCWSMMMKLVVSMWLYGRR